VLLISPEFYSLSRVVALEYAGSSFNSPQPGAGSSASTTTGTTTAESKTAAHIAYQARMGAYPYPIGAWAYHYPMFPSATGPSSVTPAVTQRDGVTNLMASGTFPYPYTAVQYSAGQSTYVPPIRYPYGAPAFPMSTPAGSTPPAGATTNPSTAQAQERTYNDIQWRQPYAGPRQPTPPAEPQAQSEPAPSADAHEPTQNLDGVESVESSTSDSGNVTPPTDGPAPTSSTTGITA